MNRNNNETAIQVRAYPVLKGIRAAADVPEPSPCRDLMTEEEVIVYLRIPEVSSAGNFRNVLDHLIRTRNLPCIHISRQRLFPLKAIQMWIMAQIRKGVA